MMNHARDALDPLPDSRAKAILISLTHDALLTYAF
jgi:hypothetical protein